MPKDRKGAADATTGKDKKKKKDKKASSRAPKSPEASAPVLPPAPPLVLNRQNAALECEGCHSIVPEVQYCLQCDRLLCPACDAKGHSLPCDAAHNRLPIGDASSFTSVRQNCPFHPGHFVQFYCRTCSMALCDDCRVSGHHGSHPHEAIPLLDAYQAALRMLQNSASPAMLYRREQLLRQSRTLQHRMEEIHSLKRSIASETQADCDAVLGRLSSDEALKISLLQNDNQQLMKEIQSVDRFLKYIATSTPLAAISEEVRGREESKLLTPKQIIEFLSRYNDLYGFAQSLVKKPFKTSIDVDASFVKEVESRYRQLSRLESVERDLQVKDQLIFKLMKERNEATVERVNKEVGRVTQESQKEMEEWSSLAQRLTTQLERFKMKCEHCGVLLLPETVNSACAEDRPHFFVPLK